MRVVYRRTGEARFLSQLDLVRTVERAVRRTGLRVGFTEGFNPRVRLSFSPALATGIETERAFFDFVVEEAAPTDEILRRLAAALPPSLPVIDCLPADAAAHACAPVLYRIVRADGRDEAPASRESCERVAAAPEGARGLVGLHWTPAAIEVQMAPGSGGAHLRALIAALGLAGPDAPPVVVRALAGDSFLDVPRSP